MRFIQGLRCKVAAGITAVTILLFAIYFAWDYQYHREQLMAELQKSATSLSNVALHGLLEIAMIGKHPEMMQRGIESLGDDASVAEIFVIDSTGVVRFSKDAKDVGRRFQQQDEGCRECHIGPGAPQSVFCRSGSNPVLRYVTPIPNRAECHSCHSGSVRYNGVLVIDFSTREAEQKLRAISGEILAKAGMSLVTVLIVLCALMNRLVILRLDKLAAATAALAEGAESPATRAVEGSDEIGQLGAAFNCMVEKLRLHQRAVEEKEQARVALLEKIVKVQEEERGKLSRELHDQLGQSLAALLYSAQSNAEGASEPGSPCGNCEGKIRDLIHEVHHLAWEMRPAILDDFGLDIALQTYIEEVSKRSSIAIDYQPLSAPGLGRLPGAIEVTLYRVAQEAIVNVMRHSGATWASVILLRQQYDIVLLVEDNGRGFERQSVRTSTKSGLGLLGINERVAFCGGTFLVESTIDQGTTVRVRIPLKEDLVCQSGL